MQMNIDMNGITTAELVELGQAIGCSTILETRNRVEEALAFSKETGDVELAMLVPMMWMAKREIDPSLTLDQARRMPFVELARGLEGVPAPVPAQRRAPQEPRQTHIGSNKRQKPHKRGR